MINKPFDEIVSDDINSLIENTVIESKTIEYKLTLPGNSDGDKKEFLKDITAFANARGGDILYGIKEKEEDGQNTGEPEEAIGLAGINTDTETRRLENIIRDGIDPRINGIHIKPIDGFQEGPILIIRIPKSWVSPHMITFRGGQKFYSRNNAGNYPLDVNEIKSVFGLSVGLGDKIKRFRNNRLSEIEFGDSPIGSNQNGKVVLHVVPIQSTDPTFIADLQEFNNLVELFKPMQVDGISHRFNYEGLLTYLSGQSMPCYTYTQIFRNGALESVNAFLLREDEQQGKIIKYITLGDMIINSLTSYIAGYKQLEIELPIFVIITILGVREYRMPLDSLRDGFSQNNPIEKDTLLLPDVVINDYDTPVDKVLKPAFDTLWQSCNYAFCPYFNDDGMWEPRRR